MFNMKKKTTVSFFFSGIAAIRERRTFGLQIPASKTCNQALIVPNLTPALLAKPAETLRFLPVPAGSFYNRQFAALRYQSNTAVPSNRIRYYYENILRFDFILKLNYKNIMQVPQICKIIILVHSVPFNYVKNVSMALEILCGQKVFRTIVADSMGQNNKAQQAARKLPFGGSVVNKRKVPLGSVTTNLEPAQRMSTQIGSVLGKVKIRKGSTNRQVRSRILASQSNSVLIYCSLNARTMYNFLDKLTSLRIAPNLSQSSSLTDGTSRYLSKTGPTYNDYKIQGQEVQVTLTNNEVRLFPEIQNHFEFFDSFQALQIKLVTSASNEKETRLLWTGLHQKDI